MANLFDYLSWRNDVPFSADPFNEIDNLILSKLAYTDFHNIIPDDGEEVSIQEVCKNYFERHAQAEITEGSSFTEKAPFLMKKMIQGARFQNTKLCYYINEIDKEKDAQISAVTFRLEDHTSFVAFRGTDNTLVGWKEDFNISYLSQTVGQKKAADYLNRISSRLPDKLRVGGHSKGGNFAVYAASFCKKELQKRILQVYTNDGPGFREEVLKSEGYQSILPKIVSIVPDTSVVGRLLSSAYEYRIIASTENGIKQHDGFSWSVQKNHFIEKEQSQLGIFIEQALGDWLNGMDDLTRNSFTNTVFSLLESTQTDTLNDMGEQKWKSMELLLSSMHELPKEKRKELSRLLKQLLQNSGQAAAKVFGTPFSHYHP